MERLRQEEFSVATYVYIADGQGQFSWSSTHVTALVIIFNITCIYLNDIKDIVK